MIKGKKRSLPEIYTEYKRQLYEEYLGNRCRGDGALRAYRYAKSKATGVSVSPWLDLVSAVVGVVVFVVVDSLICGLDVDSLELSSPAEYLRDSRLVWLGSPLNRTFVKLPRYKALRIMRKQSGWHEASLFWRVVSLLWAMRRVRVF